MKTIKFLLLSFLSFISISAIAHEKIDTIKVSGGNCAACKQQIEQTLKLDCVTKRGMEQPNQFVDNFL